MDLHIDHLDCRYRIPASVDDASVVQDRLNRIATNLLARVWENGAHDADVDNEAIYFADRVEVNLTLDASSEDDRLLAETWARELHKGVSQALRFGGCEVVVFANRSEFLASFLGDLLRSGGGREWYYGEFAALATMSLTQALTAVLTADPDAGRDALIELTRRGDLDLLLASLDEGDLTLIVEQCLLPTSRRWVLPNAYARWVDALRRLLSERKSLLTNSVPRNVAKLYLIMLAEGSGLGPDVNLAQFISELLQLRNTIAELNDRSGFFKLVASEAWERVLTGINDSEQRRFVTELARELGGQQLTAFLRELQTDSADTPTRRISTRFGGLFLLAPAVIELGLDDFLRDSPYPDPPGASPSSLLLFLISLQCFGADKAAQAAQDPALALFAGLATAPTRSYLGRYAELLTEEMHEKFRNLFWLHQAAVLKQTASRLDCDEVVDQSRWFSFGPETEDEKWDQALQPVSRALIRLFTLRLGAFAESSPAYVSRNFLECRADVEISEEHIAVRFLTCPLQMVLRMAGFDHLTVALPWLRNRELEFHFE